MGSPQEGVEVTPALNICYQNNPLAFLFFKRSGNVYKPEENICLFVEKDLANR